jgi:tetratricopeptide (TPR) repeat protein
MKVKVSIVILCVAAAVGCSRDSGEYVKSGDAYVAQQKYKDAIVEYRNAVNKDPQNGNARLKLADAYAAENDLRNAYREYVRAADLLPASREAQMKAAQILLMAGSFEDARARADKVLALNPKDVDGLMLRAAAAAGLKDYDGAFKGVQEAIELEPGKSGAYVNLGALELVKGRTAEADAAYLKAIELEPNSLPVRLAMANYQIASGKPLEALESLKRAVQIDGASPQAHRALANLYLALNRIPEAEPHFRALAADAKNESGRLALADYLALTGRIDESTGILRELEKEPKQLVPAKLRLARFHAAAGRIAEAHQTVSEALAVEGPGRAPALTLQARLYLLEQKLDDAARAVDLALASSGDLTEGHYVKAQVLLAKNDVEGARASLNEVLRLNPRASGAQVQLSRLELASGQRTRAVEMADAAVKSQPFDPSARLSLVRSLIASGSFKRAEEELKPFVAKNAEHPAVLSHLGLLKLAQKDMPAAKAAFESAFAKDPANADALNGLTTVDMNGGRREVARKRLQDRLAVDARNPQTLMLAARVEMALGDPKTAEGLLRRTIEASPYALPAYGILGQLYVQQGRLDEARREFEIAASRQSNPEVPSTLVGMILEMQGKRVEAKKQYESVLAKSPSAPIAANNLAWLQAEDGENLDRALQLAQTAKQGLPNEPQVNDTLGYIYLKKNLASLAVPPLEDAVKADPKNPRFAYRLAVAQAKLGNTIAARALLTRALQMTAPFPEASEARALLATL